MVGRTNWHSHILTSDLLGQLLNEQVLHSWPWSCRAVCYDYRPVSINTHTHQKIFSLQLFMYNRTYSYICVCMYTHIYTKPSTHSADEIPKTLRISFYHNVKKSWVADDWWSCSPFSISAVHTIMVLAKNKRMFTVIFSADCVCVRKYLVRIVCAIHGIICCRVGKSVCTMGQHNMLWMYERVYTNREWK